MFGRFTNIRKRFNRSLIKNFRLKGSTLSKKVKSYYCNPVYQRFSNENNNKIINDKLISDEIIDDKIINDKAINKRNQALLNEKMTIVWTTISLWGCLFGMIYGKSI